MPRLFVAALPDLAAVDALRALPRADEGGVRWIPESNWHVTLRFVGDAEPATVLDVLRHVDAAPCRARLGPEVVWLGGRQIVVPVSGVDELAAAVRRATASIGQLDQRPFVGHLTVGRTGGSATSSVVGAPIEHSFEVDEVVLMASELRPTGAVYRTVAEFPLDRPTTRCG